MPFSFRSYWVVLLCCAAPVSIFAGGTLTDIGALSDKLSIEATGVSADGNVVVGFARDQSANASGFRWSVSHGMQSFTALQGMPADAIAYGISADGQVIVGTTSGEAFRWSQVRGAQRLGVGSAAAASADGGVVVGRTDDQAFKWSETTGMQQLDTTNTLGIKFLRAEAKAVSTDGRVVVGNAATTPFPFRLDNSYRAVRWSADGMQVLVDSYSWATGVSADGNVIVGEFGANSGPHRRAFRWTAAGGMQDLGMPSGAAFAGANAVSADGKVVVGTYSGQENYGGFRWNAASGMQTVEQWLNANGAAVAADATRSADAVNADGSVVVGQLKGGHAYLARVDGVGSGLVSLAELESSLTSAGAVGTQALDAAGLLLHGAHGQPLARRVEPGRSCVWASGDWGQANHGNRDGSAGLAELGACRALARNLQAGVALGHSWGRQHWVGNGESKLNGAYLLSEWIGALPVTGLWGTLTGFYHWGEANIRRGYASGASSSVSYADPSIRSWGVSARLDWENAAQWGPLALSPYAKFSHARARIEGYRESGGGFPASFDARQEQASEARLGVTGAVPYGAVRVVGTLEAAHRFEHAGRRVTGQVDGLFSFDLPAQPQRRSWLRAGVGMEQRLGTGTASLFLNVSSHGHDPVVWLNAGYRIAF